MASTVPPPRKKKLRISANPKTYRCRGMVGPRARASIHQGQGGRVPSKFALGDINFIVPPKLSEDTDHMGHATPLPTLDLSLGSEFAVL